MLCRSLAAVAMTMGATAILSIGATAAYAAGPDPQGTIYVGDEGTNAIYVYAPGSSGNVAPERTIEGPDTGISEPGDVKVDASGDIWITNFSANSLTEYAPGASGDASPICTIQGSNTELDYPDDMSLEANGTLVVASFYNAAGTGGNGSIELFAPGQCGNVTPEEFIAGSNTGFNVVDGVGTDASGTIYAANTGGAGIDVFPAGANGNVAPERTITGPDTGLGSPDDVVVGFNGNVYTTSGFGGPLDSVEEFGSGASGDATPLIDITGSNTDMGNIDDLAVDAGGTIYGTDGESSLGPAVLEWTAGSNGNVAPTNFIAGPNTGLSIPEGVFVAGPPANVSATVSTTAAASSIALGQGTSDQATVAGGTVSPTGQIVFQLFGPNDSTCSQAPAYVSSPVTVTGDATYSSPSFTPTAVGTYYWVAEYSGDANNSAVTTACADASETVTVQQASQQPVSVFTSLSGGGQSAPQIFVPNGSSVSDQATLSGANTATAGGTLTYNVYADPGCTVQLATDTVNVTNGVVPASSGFVFPEGTYWWQATYNGDPNNLAQTSTCRAETEVVLSTARFGADVGVSDYIYPGTTITGGAPYDYVICFTVTNYGPNTAKNIISALLLPSGVTVVNNGGASTQIGRLLIFKTGTFTAGETETYEVWVSPSGKTTGGSMLDAAALSLGTLDPNYANNFAAQAVTFNGARMGYRLSPSRAGRDVLLARLRALGRELPGRTG